MKEYFYAFLLGIASPAISHVLVLGLWLVFDKPHWIPIGDILFWILALSLGTLFFFKFYCPRKGTTLDTNQKVWAGMWYAIGIAIAYSIYWYIMFLLYHPHCGLQS